MNFTSNALCGEDVAIRPDGKQKVAYVIGPLRSKNKVQRDLNFARAAALAEWLWLLGFAVISPHANGGPFDGVVPDHVIMEGHKRLMEISDIVIVMEVSDLHDSLGSKAEILAAAANGQEVRYVKF